MFKVRERERENNSKCWCVHKPLELGQMCAPPIPPPLEVGKLLALPLVSLLSLCTVGNITRVNERAQCALSFVRGDR